VPKKIVKMKKAFTLIELLVVIAILGILSGTGIVAYNGYTAFAKENATKNNHKAIVNNMENEFAKCKLDKDSKIFETHPCNSSSRPSTNTISNYANTKLSLKNPYDNTLPVVQSNICTSGSVSIVEKEIGNYDVAYASVKKQTKYNSLVSSGWSSNYSKTTSTSVSFSCTQTTTTKKSFDTYKVSEGLPMNGFGAYIVVDKNGKMTSNWATYSGCEYNYCGNKARENGTGGYDVLWDKLGNKKAQPGEYVFVLIQANRGAQLAANSAVPFNSDGQKICTNRDCTYNFANNTFTDDRTGQVFEAGSGQRVK
jgi:prepilin-type N-terminal cleavage/methylation domain-containing protein